MILAFHYDYLYLMTEDTYAYNLHVWFRVLYSLNSYFSYLKYFKT